MSGRDLNPRFVRRTALSMLLLGQATTVTLLFVLHILNITLVDEGGGCGGVIDPAGDLLVTFLGLEICALLLPVLTLVAGLGLGRRSRALGRTEAVLVCVGIVLAARLAGIVLLARGRPEDLIAAFAFSLIFTLGLPEIVAGGLAVLRRGGVYGDLPDWPLV